MEKTPIEERHPSQVRLFNEAEALAKAAERAPSNVTIPSDPLVHCDETRLQVLKSDKTPTADHWIWFARAARAGDALFYLITMPHAPARFRDACSMLSQPYSPMAMAMKPMTRSCVH